jgi:hypothetical protein
MMEADLSIYGLALEPMRMIDSGHLYGNSLWAILSNASSIRIIMDEKSKARCHHGPDHSPDKLSFRPQANGSGYRTWVGCGPEVPFWEAL